MRYAIGLDYGANSYRCVIVNTTNNEEVGTAIYEYETGDHGIILGKRDHDVARQNPADYMTGIEVAIKKAIAAVKNAGKKFKAESVIGSDALIEGLVGGGQTYGANWTANDLEAGSQRFQEAAGFGDFGTLYCSSGKTRSGTCSKLEIHPYPQEFDCR
jgi:hypothetical protein